MSYIFKMLGVIGLLLITRSIFIKKEIKRDWVATAGGVCLLMYSIYLRDLIFTILQIIFVVASIYEAKKLTRAERTLPILISPQENAELIEKNIKHQM